MGFWTKQNKIDKQYDEAIKERQKQAQEKLEAELRSKKAAFLENPSPELATEIESFENKMSGDVADKTKGVGNQAAGALISEAGGDDPLAQGLAAGVSTGNPLVGVGMGVLAGIQGAQKEKQRKANIDANALMEQANNEQNTQLRRSAAIQSLASNLSRSLVGGK